MVLLYYIILEKSSTKTEISMTVYSKENQSHPLTVDQTRTGNPLNNLRQSYAHSRDQLNWELGAGYKDF